MKKLLILMLVLGLASIASAALQISVHIPAQEGIPDPIDYGYLPPDSEIKLLPSQYLYLDIGTDIPITAGGEGEGQWALTCQTSCGAISGGVAVIQDSDWEIGIEEDAVGNDILGLPDGDNGVWGWVFTFGKAIPAGTIYDEILFHCETDNGPTVVTLWYVDADGYVQSAWDTVTIHQIPEPASMLLLGLGGLLLRRRK